jgi:hypothetical protein
MGGVGFIVWQDFKSCEAGSKRYVEAVRTSSGLKSLLSGIDDSHVLRAVEQRMINYVRSKSP